MGEQSGVECILGRLQTLNWTVDDASQKHKKYAYWEKAINKWQLTENWQMNRGNRKKKIFSCNHPPGTLRILHNEWPAVLGKKKKKKEEIEDPC